MSRLVRGGLFEPHEHAGLMVSTSEVMALGELSAQAMSQQELGSRLGLEKSTVSRLAAGLDDRGWLIRERDPDNRRFYRLRLTEQGQDAADRIGADLSHHHQALLSALTTQERRALSIGLRALARVLAERHGHHHHDEHDRDS